MADAFKCDRCGRHYDGIPKNVKELVVDSINFGPVYTNYDFCENCIKDFYEFCKGVPPKTLAEKLRDILKKD